MKVAMLNLAPLQASFCSALLLCAAATSAALPPQALIPLRFTGVWAEAPDACKPGAGQPTFTISSNGFEGLPGQKAYPKIKSIDRTGRKIRVSFYNSNGALSWRSEETMQLSRDGRYLSYTFAGGTLQWVRCSEPASARPSEPAGAVQAD